MQEFIWKNSLGITPNKRRVLYENCPSIARNRPMPAGGTTGSSSRGWQTEQIDNKTTVISLNLNDGENGYRWNLRGEPYLPNENQKLQLNAKEVWVNDEEHLPVCKQQTQRKGNKTAQPFCAVALEPQENHDAIHVASPPLLVTEPGDIWQRGIVLEFGLLKGRQARECLPQQNTTKGTFNYLIHK